MRRRILGGLGVLPLVFAGVGTGAAQAADAPTPTSYTDGVYIVQMLDAPVAAYDGSRPGLPETAPKDGRKIAKKSAEVQGYVKHLEKTHDDALRQAGANGKVYDYSYAFNGFSARLTGAEAAKLAKQPGVAIVSKSQTYTIDTSSTPHFLGLDDPKSGLWTALGGPSKAGEDVIIGIIDSGIWPESLSFSDKAVNGVPSATGPVVYGPAPAGWSGSCDLGEGWTATTCNNKLIGARYYNRGAGGNAGVDASKPWEYNSARDYNGHGTHTASTSGGNYATPTTGPATGLGASISGMAPRARIAAYKALWSTKSGDTASGSGVDLVAAIDQAVADGVDVINYSISGSSTNFADPVEISFLFAARAGVFVAASAGNSGPDPSTVAHPSPWITTVAAGTHNRSGTGSVTLGNGATYTGASIAAPVGPAPLVLARDAGLAGADPTKLRLCYSADDGAVVLDPAKVAGKIVVCDRGVTARVNKSAAVKAAGGVGMILANTSANSINADFHFVPTVHVTDTDAAAIKAYATSSDATATINQATISYTAPAPGVASFSSRGPLLAGSGDLLKPDLIAPGQDILAAVSPDTAHGMDFNLLSGTSMSSPHVAGLAALLRAMHPTWTPMAIKSALMTTGKDVIEAGTLKRNQRTSDPEVVFAQGAGHVQPNLAANPGLVYDSGWADWLAFLCGTTDAVGPNTCATLKAAGYSTDPSDLNTPSIAIGDLAGKQTVTRRVTNVSDRPVHYDVKISGMTGFKVNVEPSSFNLRPGQTIAFRVTITRTTAALDTYGAGYLTWGSERSARVSIPIVVRPVALAAPATVAGTGAPISYPVTFGYSGAFTASARGLVAATTTPGSVTDDPGDKFSPTGPGVWSTTVTVPAGTTLARFATYDSAMTGSNDVDMYVYNSAGKQVGMSGGGTSDEHVDLVDPPAGVYTVYVHGFAVPAGSASFTLFSWLVDSTAAGNMTVAAPATATSGATGTITLSFTGLAPATRYLGSVAYGGQPGLPDPTVVEVNTP